MLGHAGHVVQAASPLGGGPRDLLDEDRPRHTAPAGRVERVLDGDVVVDQHGADGQALGRGELGGRLEVEHVAGVVLHDVEDPRPTVDGAGRREDRVGRG